MAGNIYGLDLGTYEIKVYDERKDEIWKEKSAIATKNQTEIFAVGDEAYAMYEKAPQNIEVLFPMQGGVIARFYDMQNLLENLLRKRQFFGSEYVIAIPLGLLAAVRKNGVADRTLTILTIVLWSMPPFWLGVLFILTFSVWLGILPISGWDGFASLILPAFTLALPSLAQIFRLTRSEVLDVLDEKYVTTAYAKGLKNKVVLVKHVLRNAMIPVTVMFFLSLPWLIGGAVVVENVFAWPGMGQLIWKAISKQDFVIVQGVVLVITILTVICNLIGDILAGILDPRIRLE